VYLVPGAADDFFLDLLRDDDNTVNVREHQVAGREADAVDLDGNVDVDHALTIFAVVNAGAACENGKLHAAHLADVAHRAVDDRSDAPAVAGRDRKSVG